MRQINHVLKDGTKLDDISGYVVKEKEFQNLYKYLSKIIIKEKRSNESKTGTKSKK